VMINLILKQSSGGSNTSCCTRRKCSVWIYDISFSETH
jgi:hypothetical protein